MDKLTEKEFCYFITQYPEFKRYYNCEPRRFIELYESNRDVWRRVVLRLSLEELKANEEIC